LLFEGPAEALTLTTNTQPAILTVSVMAWAALREAIPNLRVAYAAGHSLGEFSALVAAGALDLDDAIPLVRDRGAFMQSAVPVGEGAMVACLEGPGPVTALVEAVRAEGTHGVLDLANFNGPTQTVISGSAAAVARAREIGAEYGVKKMIPLDVSAPFHSSLMQPAQDRFATRLADVPINPFSFPVVTNLEAAPNDQPDRVREILTRQITSPVRWTEICQYLLDAGCDTFIECGTGTVLSNMLKRGWKDAVITCLNVSDTATLAATVEALKEHSHV
ncbi:MAG: ACP S-malonyltransferase, partial [bacterium]